MTFRAYAPIAVAALFASSPVLAQSTETTRPAPTPAVTEPAAQTTPAVVKPAAGKSGCMKDRHAMS